jgi:hypothetical protein
MRKYVLIAFRTNDDKPMFSYMLDSITEITESKFLKFKEVGNAIIIHFGSSRNFEELKKYVNIVLSKCSDINFLFENNDNMSVNMCFEDLGTFLSLDEDILSPKVDKTETREYDNISNEFMLSFINSISNELNDDCIDEDEDEDDEYIKKSLKKEYNLDDILDKINEKGVSSLTQEENDYLKKLSK